MLNLGIKSARLPPHLLAGTGGINAFCNIRTTQPLVMDFAQRTWIIGFPVEPLAQALADLIGVVSGLGVQDPGTKRSRDVEFGKPFTQGSLDGSAEILVRLFEFLKPPVTIEALDKCLAESTSRVAGRLK